MRSPSIFIAVLVALISPSTRAAEVIPPKPDRYFNDYAGVVSKEAAHRFNEQLAQFERETSNQVVVAVFPKMETDSSIEDYAQRVAESWDVGQKILKNGVVLLVFIADRKMSIQVGYGLEGTLPDIIAYDIRENHIKPRFRNNDYEGGLATGIDLIFKSIRGEYKGSGKTAAEKSENETSNWGFLLVLLVIVILVVLTSKRRKRGYSYTHSGGPFVGGWSSGSAGGWSSGGSGGFSGFSGGGGSFGGGGSSGSW